MNGTNYITMNGYLSITQFLQKYDDSPDEFKDYITIKTQNDPDHKNQYIGGETKSDYCQDKYVDRCKELYQKIERVDLFAIIDILNYRLDYNIQLNSDEFDITVEDMIRKIRLIENGLELDEKNNIQLIDMWNDYDMDWQFCIYKLE